MSSRLQPLSPSNSKRFSFSRDGFKPIPSEQQYNNMPPPPPPPPNDATIDIPLEQVHTNASSGGGLRNHSTTQNMRPAAAQSSHDTSPENEKSGFFKGRRMKPIVGVQGTGRVGYDGEEDTLTTMGRIYHKIYTFSIITRYLFYVVPVGILIAVPIVVGALLLNHDTGSPGFGGVPILWFFVWVEIIWCSLWISKVVAHFLPYIFQVFVGVVSSGVRKYATVLRKLEIPLSLVGWAVTSLATFKPLMTENSFNAAHSNALKGKQWIDIVQNILAAALISTLIFLAERFFIQLISINYHRKQFNSRIKDSKHHVFLLTLLYDASRTLFPPYGREFADEDYIISDQLQLEALGGKRRPGQPQHHRSGSATPLRLIHNIGRIGDQVTSAFGNVASEITGKDVFNPNGSHSVVVTALEKKRATEALARRIWMSFVMEGREALMEDDVIDVLGPDRRSEAEEAFWALDRDGNGDVSLDEMIMTIMEWSRERKAIASSMVDVASAINVLDRMLCTVVLIAVVFVFIALLNKNFVTTLATTGTALLSLSFVFSVTAQEVLGSCIFLFVKHPFDIGDRVDIKGEAFTVEHMSLLFTVFRHASGTNTGQLCQYPNIVLNTYPLENVSRSKSMTEQIKLDICFDTTFEDIQILKNELKNFVTDKDNSRDFQPDLEVDVLGTTDMSKLQLQVEIKHKSNWANETLRASRRSRFMCALVAALRAVPIYPPGGGVDAAGSAANPNYAVTITDAEAKENAGQTADEREKARLIPTKKIEDAKNTLELSPTMTSNKAGMLGLSHHDANIIDDLTTRDPASDPVRDQAWTSGRDDASTLGGRASSVDNQGLDDVRGMLRRESTRGKRKAGTGSVHYQHPAGIPTIREPDPMTYSTGYTSPYTESQAQQYFPSSAAEAPYQHHQPTQYQSATSNNPPVYTTTSGGASAGNVEMSQLPSRSASNPYRNRSESVSRRPMSPTAGGGQHQGDEEFENTRPYSGV